MKSLGIVNARTNKSEDLYEIEFTPKGAKEKGLVYVYATDRLSAGNVLVQKKVWGTQHEVRVYLDRNFLSK